MTIYERMHESTAAMRDRAAAYALRAAAAARAGAERAADRIRATSTPVDTLADAARRLNTLSHRHVGRLLDQSVTTVRGFMTDGTQRLRRAAKAQDLQALCREQLERLPASRDRIVKNARATWEILTDTGRELQTIALATYAQLAGRQPPSTTGTTRTTKAAKKKRAPRKAA